MSSELERRLEGLLAAAPEPEAGAGEEALHRALGALRPAAPAHRGLRTTVLVFAAAAVLLAIAAGSLAAAGALHVSFGAKPKPHRPAAPKALTLPPGAEGVAAVVDGRLSVVTSSGFRLQGLPVSSATLSPHAWFVAAGIGRSLVAIRPNGSHAWSHPAGGTVVAIAWAPEGNRIAYVVREPERLVLHVIWGNGTNDMVIDRRVRAVRPSWRADSLAVAYVGGGGKAIVYDVAHLKHSVAGAIAPVTRLAFAPVGKTLLVATPSSARVGRQAVATGKIEAVGWFHGRPAVALETHPTGVRVQTFGRSSRRLDDFFVPGRVVGFSGGLVVTRDRDRILAGWREKKVEALLGLSHTASVEDLAIR